MPMRERRSGESRVMSSPLYRMLPRDERRSPESRLISVVLPAPLGPSTAWSLPRWSSIATLATAIRPPKRRDRSVVARIASLILGLPDRRALETAPDAGEATRQEDHQRDDRRTQQQLPMRRDVGVDLLQRDKREGADDRA